ncbi:BTB/POZ fold protein [Metarhizium brunneum]
MTRAPLDGRPRQLERPPLRAHHQSRNKTNTSYMDHLRPASPPKTNPWVKRPSAASLAPEWPVCTPDFSQENEVPAQEKATSRSVKFICSADTKDSDAVSPSKKLLQAAAPRACTRLWLRPFGADVFVWAGREVFEVHRSIVESQSAWLRQNLPPANKKGTPSDLRLPFCPQVVGYALRFMYTESLEILEYDRENFCDLICIPRSALLYVGAVDLGVEAMKDHIEKVLGQMSQDLACYLTKTFVNKTMEHEEVAAAVFHLRNALEVAYSHESQAETLCLRRGLASLLDILFPVLIPHPEFVNLLSDKVWKDHSEAISHDLVYARRAKER